MISSHVALSPEQSRLAPPIARGLPMDGTGTHPDPVREERYDRRSGVGDAGRR